MPLSNTGVDRFLAQNYYSKTQLNSGQLDTRYFAESEFVNSSAGAGDSGKPVKLNGSGKIDATMITDSDIDHGSTGGLSDDDHTQYVMLAGRSGGQTLYGGTGANDDITIHGTSNGTRTTSYVILQPTAGKVGIGTSGPGAKLSVYEPTALGSTSGNSQIVSELAGNSGSNTFLQKYYLYRDSNGSDWQTTRLHDALDVDGSFSTPGTNTRVWYERDPNNVIHAWGDQTTTYMTLTSGTLNVATAITQNGVAVVTTSGSQTLTNKTLTAPTIGATEWSNANHTHAGATTGGQISHTVLSNIGTYSHTTIDTHIDSTVQHGATGAIVGTTNTQTLTNKTLTTPIIGTVYGGSAANDDITIHGTSNATRTSSYAIIQPSGGKTVVGGSTADYRFEVQDAGASNYRFTFNLNDTSENVLGSINDVVGSFTQAPLRIYASRIKFNGTPNIMTTVTPTGTADASGSTGDYGYDNSYWYVKTGAGWKRAALSTW